MPYFKQPTTTVVANEDVKTKTYKYTAELETNLTNGETARWIPEDSVKLKKKTIYKDGEYEAYKDAGRPYAYSEVEIVQIDKRIKRKKGFKTINQNGIYIADEERGRPGYYYTSVFVNVGDGGELYDGR